ncbi:ABC transporter substrate-binding protein [Glycomyces algeriensis]|uniref:ABC transporter substrate-binding protein n=1 Tax=Glycomyces algeriensis TaxID=256037 RepID=A0A9W6GE16_9ACTN|nr:ABC transporter substrate-binding protein [Glycomyces algeriensis]MDA1368547.1 ABC transporter substrate-binding protein [Glycomyces algeriensis]MDR7352346.1 peptide/nickel transport system substrate-binding protein [Glycomyces algeriensis]GLI45082.1 ABC transporter substrate-binding protein [Glycomyces algeriensis]
MPLSRRTLLTAAAPLGLGGVLATTGCFSSDATASGGLVFATALTPAAGLSPHSEDAFLLARWAVAETLVGLDGNGLPVPKLALDWTQAAPNDWDLTLREGVRFHDGTVLDAAAVAAALNAAATAASVPRVIDGLGLTAEATGDRTLRVTTAAPDPVLPQRLSSPYLAILAPGAYQEDTVDPVGFATGPFRITESTSTGAVLERSGDHWGEQAAMAGYRADYVPDAATRVAALRSGEAHVIEAVPYAQIANLDASQLQDAPTGRTVSLYLNTATGPLADPALRAAVAAAIDTAPIVDDIYEGRADAPEGLFGPALSWAADHREYTLPDAAVPAGEALRLATYSNRAELPEALIVLASQLEAAGFAVETEVREYNDIEPDMLAGEFDAFLMSRSVVQDSGDAYTYLDSDFTGDGGFNASRLADPAVDQAVAAIATAAAPDMAPDAAAAARQSAVLDAEAVVLATVAVIPIAHERLVTGVAGGAANVHSDPREREIITTATTME